jgi:hypothetical protein
MPWAEAIRRMGGVTHDQKHGRAVKSLWQYAQFGQNLKKPEEEQPWP